MESLRKIGVFLDRINGVVEKIAVNMAWVMLLAITLAGNMMGMAFRKWVNKMIPVLVVLVGIFFVLRGLNLGIPYLSPPREKIEQKFEKSLKKEGQEAEGEEAEANRPGSCCSKE